jgi:hypothetical protein
MKKLCFFIHSYGKHQTEYLFKILDIINNYKKYKSKIFLYLTENIDVSSYCNIEISTITYPETIKTDLSFQHKLFIKNNFDSLKKEYDIFIGLENDILLKEQTIEYFEKYQNKVNIQDYAIGTLRYEIKDEIKYYIDTGIDSIDDMFEYVLSINDKKFYKIKHNNHSGMFIFLTEQINLLLNKEIDLMPKDLESSISNFYKGKWPASTNGIQKIICLEDLEKISVHHLPNKYVMQEKFMNECSPKSKKDLEKYLNTR